MLLVRSFGPGFSRKKQMKGTTLICNFQGKSIGILPIKMDFGSIFNYFWKTSQTFKTLHFRVRVLFLFESENTYIRPFFGLLILLHTPILYSTPLALGISFGHFYLLGELLYAWAFALGLLFICSFIYLARDFIINLLASGFIICHANYYWPLLLSLGILLTISALGHFLRAGEI